MGHIYLQRRTWQNGRQLAYLQKGNNNIQYSYDSEGIRVSKTINGEKCTFEYLNGMLLYETRGEKYFHYYYDSNGMLCAVSYRLTPSDDENIYYYTHNWRGDIVGIYNGNGDLRAKYTYDSWGNVTSITDGNGNVITDQNHVGNLNPFRYRGYYMDTETGMYYLMSRYYDPVTHRFVNADGYFQTGLGILDGNMNAYCGNNPIMCFDPNGDIVTTIGFSGFASFGLAGSASLYYACDDKGNYGFFYAYSDFNNSGGMGIFGASFNVTSSVIWDADTIDDLDKNYSNLGFSVGEGFCAGLDLITLDNYELPSGISLSAGIGVGIDWAHVYTTTNHTIWKSTQDYSNASVPQKTSPSSKSNFSTNKNNYKRCIQCGCPHILVK